jgi:hypothetical protein
MAPTVTIQAESITLLGALVPITISAQLVDPNQTGGLKVVSTGIIPDRVQSSTAQNLSTITVGPVYGNDVIEDSGNNVNTTYYVVSVFLKNVLTPFFQNTYQFAGSGTFDILTATPYAPVVLPANSVAVAANLFYGGPTSGPAAIPTFRALPAAPVLPSGTQALGTTLISSGAASTVISTAVAGVLATDNIVVDFSSDPSGVTGYAPSASGMLTIIKWCSTGHINFYQYNNTAASITPGAVTLNYKIVR